MWAEGWQRFMDCSEGTAPQTWYICFCRGVKRSQTTRSFFRLMLCWPELLVDVFPEVPSDYYCERILQGFRHENCVLM